MKKYFISYASYCQLVSMFNSEKLKEILEVKEPNIKNQYFVSSSKEGGNGVTLTPSPPSHSLQSLVS